VGIIDAARTELEWDGVRSLPHDSCRSASTCPLKRQGVMHHPWGHSRYTVTLMLSMAAMMRLAEAIHNTCCFSTEPIARVTGRMVG
jgi:hypothetical protein